MIGVGVAWIVEPLLGSPSRRRTSAGSTSRRPDRGDQRGRQRRSLADDVRLSWWGGAMALFVWAAAFAGVGIVRVVRQDIS